MPFPESIIILESLEKVNCSYKEIHFKISSKSTNIDIKHWVSCLLLIGISHALVSEGLETDDILNRSVYYHRKIWVGWTKYWEQFEVYKITCTFLLDSAGLKQFANCSRPQGNQFYFSGCYTSPLFYLRSNYDYSKNMKPRFKAWRPNWNSCRSFLCRRVKTSNRWNILIAVFCLLFLMTFLVSPTDCRLFRTSMD